MDIQEFLNENNIDEETAEIIVADRFVDKNGEPLNFTIKAISNKEMKELKAKSYRTYTNAKGQRVKEFDDDKFKSLLVINSTIMPNFKDAESLERVGCITAEEYLNKKLKPGEIHSLSDAILNLSGYGDTITQLKEEIKN